MSAEEDSVARRRLSAMCACSSAAVRLMRREGMLYSLKQSHVGPLHVGQVSEVHVGAPVAELSPLSVYNISPIGEWSIHVDKELTSGANPTDIEDIYLHFKVALIA